MDLSLIILWSLIVFVMITWIFDLLVVTIDYLLVSNQFNSRYYRFNSALAMCQSFPEERYYLLLSFYAKYAPLMKDDNEMSAFADGYFARVQETLNQTRVF
jgi:hypothetical protein